MRSDNENKSMKLNRLFAKPGAIVITIACFDLLMVLAMSYAINSIARTFAAFKESRAAGTQMGDMTSYMGIENIIPKIFSYGPIGMWAYVILGIFLLIFSIFFAYRIRASFSEGDINHGQRGTSRWTTIPEVAAQYKRVPLAGKTYKGKGGTIVSRQREHLYVDDSFANTLVVGTTRSGKGEMYVFPSIDVYSRAEKIEDRPSMIISDPKVELYKSSKERLEKRGYLVRLLNLDDPNASMGYNPLQLVIDHYKAGRVERAQMAAKTFAFSIFNADSNNQEAIWKNTATDLFTALIIAIASDCLDMDKKENEKRYQAYMRKREAFELLDEEEKEEAQKRYEQLAADHEDLFCDDRITYIPQHISFVETHANEKKVNCFSVINFFRELCDRAAMGADDPDETLPFEKKAETALDDYFNSRSKLDFAAALYNEIKTAGDRTKGSVYINMLSAVSVFNLENIARMTAESDFAFEEIGYGDKPVAIFIGIPSEDRSNHFIATTFMAQVYQHLFSLSKASRGKLKRKVKFIIDEFGNFPPMENFAGFVTVGLGIGASFDIYVQSYNQIPAKYGDEAKTILENFANQIYIKSIGNESADEFSQMLGNRTIINVQRSGGRFSTDKNYTETTEERPLMYPDELARLKEGECVVYRGMKRTDRLGTAIESYPIINEYGDSLSLVENLVIFFTMFQNRIIRKRVLLHPEDREPTSWREERMIRQNDRRRYKGTALLYRYQYLQDDFPNPGDIDLVKINTESRSHIDYEKRVYDPEIVLAKLENPGSKNEEGYKTYEMLDCFQEIDTRLKESFGDHYMEILGISKKDSVSSLHEKIANTEMKRVLKESLFSLLQREVG
jgi:type IV secretion system protein VirD4